MLSVVSFTFSDLLHNKKIYSYVITPLGLKILSDTNTHACITHFWLTGGNHSYIDNAVIRYYIDGEKVPSVEFQPSLACGVGFGEDMGPWGTLWIGKVWFWVLSFLWLVLVLGCG